MFLGSLVQCDGKLEVETGTQPAKRNQLRTAGQPTKKPTSTAAVSMATTTSTPQTSMPAPPRNGPRQDCSTMSAQSKHSGAIIPRMWMLASRRSGPRKLASGFQGPLMRMMRCITVFGVRVAAWTPCEETASSAQCARTTICANGATTRRRPWGCCCLAWCKNIILVPGISKSTWLGWRVQRTCHSSFIPHFQRERCRACSGGPSITRNRCYPFSSVCRVLGWWGLVGGAVTSCELDTFEEKHLIPIVALFSSSDGAHVHASHSCSFLPSAPRPRPVCRGRRWTCEQSWCVF